MPYAPTYAEGPLRLFAAALEKSLRRPVRVQWTAGTNGDPCAWVEVQDMRAASLTIELRGPTASYVVARADKAAPPKKLPALATALRELKKTIVQSPPPAAVAQTPIAPTKAARDDPADPHTPVGAQEAKEPQSYRTRYTADQAAGHPVIRAAVIVGHEVRRAKGAAPDPVALLTLANRALDVVDLLVPPGRPEAATDAWVERALVGMLTGALLAI
ncbi:hypothetical protein ABIC90_001422 [Variovorax boronicumulans]